MNWKVGIILVGAGVLIGGCFTPDRPSLTSTNADTKIPAIKEAADKHDRTAIPILINGLDDRDPAIRLASFEALEELTGQTFDYQYFDEDADRRPAVMKWKQWLTEHPEAVKPGGK